LSSRPAGCHTAGVLSAPLSILAFLVAVIAAAEWLDNNTRLRHLGAALLVIVFAALATNVGIIPAYGQETPVYDAIFTWIAPLGIFWLLLLVDLGSVLRAGTPSLVLFLIGAAGTVGGVVLAYLLEGGRQAFGDLSAALAGMYTGTYIGGSVNFNAVALAYGVNESPALYAGAAAVDNAATTVWMIACVALPRLLAPLWPRRPAPAPAVASVPGAADTHPAGSVSLFDLSVVLALGLCAVLLADAIAGGIAALTGLAIPSVLVLTTIALLLAQLPPVQGLRASRILGLFAVYLFLAVIGTLCDLGALTEIGALAPRLLLFVTVVVLVHGITVFGAARLLGFDVATAAVASQANIGGGTTALALARSLGRADLELPAILVGSLGTALGNYLGFLVVALLS
jgi:uncharacterized membrane protein